MNDALRRAVQGVGALVLLFSPQWAAAQSVDVGGRAFVDYVYTLSSPDANEEGFHGFTYRRLYLTTDFRLDEDFRGRARLEANDGTTGPKGPVPFVKDLWLEWTYAGDHTATIGVTPPPAYTIAEGVWGYRSLEKTILDFQGVVASRDFGIRFNGPLLADGTIRYAAMIANNSASRPEFDKYKRAYAQLEFYPTDNLTFTVGADQAGYPDPLESSTRVSAFGGYESNDFSIGLEAYSYALRSEDDAAAEHLGASLFGSVRIAPQWELIGRLDRIRESAGPADLIETFFLGAVSYSPTRNVRIIPNLWLRSPDSVEVPESLARLTVDVRF